MIEVWPTVVWPLMEALRPAIIVDGSLDGRLLGPLSERAAAWSGRVIILEEPAGGAPEFLGDAYTRLDLEVWNIRDRAATRQAGAPQMALLHGDANWWTVSTHLQALLALSRASSAPFALTLVHDLHPSWGSRDHYVDPQLIPQADRQPYRSGSGGSIALDEGTPRNGVLAAVSEFAQAHEQIQAVLIPGLGGTAVLFEQATMQRAPDAVRGLIDELRSSPALMAHMTAVDEERLRALVRAPEARVDHDVADIELMREEMEAMRIGLREMSDLLSQERVRAQQTQAQARQLAQGSDSAQSQQTRAQREGECLERDLTQVEEESELSSRAVNDLLRPDQLLAAIGWSGEAGELSLPIPFDVRGITNPASPERVVVIAGEEEIALRRTLCSILERATSPVSVAVLVGSEPPDWMTTLLRRASMTASGVRIVRTRENDGEGLVLAAGEELPWGWPLSPKNREDLEVVYLLPGLPAEGSGGSHSVVQEARGIRELGGGAQVLVPEDCLLRARALYEDDDHLFLAYQSDTLIQAVAAADVAVATEHTSVPDIARLAKACPELVCAYYVQDYEALFAAPGSPRSDQALLSYRAVPGLLLYAKTHWVLNIVRARHRVPVTKVAPSLDSAMFHPVGRVERPSERTRVLAMIRPRTPRRRPRATLQALTEIHEQLGERVQINTFGCTAQELATVNARSSPPGRHHGLLSSAQVASLMRGSDLFIDASAYQAFGRTGLEAMACGAVPILPAVGGVHEYAVDGRNALIGVSDDPRWITDAVISLAGDPERLASLKAHGLRTSASYSIAAGAESQLDLFASAARAKAGSGATRAS